MDKVRGHGAHCKGVARTLQRGDPICQTEGTHQIDVDLRALIDVKKGLQRGVTDIPGTHTLPAPLPIGIYSFVCRPRQPQSVNTRT